MEHSILLAACGRVIPDQGQYLSFARFPLEVVWRVEVRH